MMAIVVTRRHFVGTLGGDGPDPSATAHAEVDDKSSDKNDEDQKITPDHRRTQAKRHSHVYLAC